MKAGNFFVFVALIVTVALLLGGFAAADAEQTEEASTPAPVGAAGNGPIRPTATPDLRDPEGGLPGEQLLDEEVCYIGRPAYTCTSVYYTRGCSGYLKADGRGGHQVIYLELGDIVPGNPNGCGPEGTVTVLIQAYSTGCGGCTDGE